MEVKITAKRLKLSFKIVKIVKKNRMMAIISLRIYHFIVLELCSEISKNSLTKILVFTLES